MGLVRSHTCTLHFTVSYLDPSDPEVPSFLLSMSEEQGLFRKCKWQVDMSAEGWSHGTCPGVGVAFPRPLLELCQQCLCSGGESTGLLCLEKLNPEREGSLLWLNNTEDPLPRRCN